MTARDAAIKLIEVYVRRGDSLASLKGSYMGTMYAPWIANIRGDWILVDNARDQVAQQRFKLVEIYNHIKSGQQGLPLYDSAS